MKEAPLNQPIALATGRRPAPSAETTDLHTGILRLALGIEESRAYWEHADPATLPAAATQRAVIALEQRWFGAKTPARIRFVLGNLAARYDQFPDALTVLHRWPAMDPATRQVICHWHLQLSDPIYRRFTGQFLVERRQQSGADLDRSVVLRWVQREFPDRWSAATCIQFASKLLSAASEAGLVSPRKDPRKLLLPRVPDLALSYLLYLLRSVHFEGTLLDNPYLLSCGIDAADRRLATVPGLSVGRMGDLLDVEWQCPDLATWADRFVPAEGQA